MHRDLVIELLDPATSAPAETSAGVAPNSATVAGKAATPTGRDVEVVTFHGFDLDDRPLLVGIAALPGELVPARSTVPLLREAMGSSVVVVFEKGDSRRPIVIGVIAANSELSGAVENRAPVVRVDDADKLVLRSEREIVLECGDASITLTRAGKVLIRGRYILSRATGYNRIKGAAIDIN